MKENKTAALPFDFLDELVLRSPALPFSEGIDDTKIDALLHDEHFLEAVYLASPVLYNECIRLTNGQITEAKEIKKIRASLVKYYQRMYSRCTPFGLFSACSLLHWHDGDTTIELPADSFDRSTRLDMHYGCALGQHLASIPVIKARLKFFPNNSAYRIGNEERYIEYRYQQGRRMHQISSVQYSGYLQEVLDKATNGATMEELIQLLVTRAEVAVEEAADFVEEMISGQLLISELDPAITGETFLQQLIFTLHKLNVPADETIAGIIQQLSETENKLKELDKQGRNSPATYKSLVERIVATGVSFDESKLFQADMFVQPLQDKVSKSLQADLLHSVELLARLFSSTANENLSSFADRFRKRYEDRELPLLQVLDAETGIGYSVQQGKNLSPLLEQIMVPATTDRDAYEIKWNKTEQWLFTQLLNLGDKKEIVIEEKDLESFTLRPSIFPPSMSLIFSLVEDNRIVFKGCNGSSAVNLLGRFAHGSNQIKELAQKIADTEQAKNPDIIFAEIIHLPEDRVGNILLHPAFRDYEIPFLAQSSLSPAQQIPLQDITVSVSNNRIRLFSRRLNKEIIPRLSNAHNYSSSALPVYHFLSDMQSQDLLIGIGFHWGRMASHFRYLPRVSSGSVIVSEATWQLRKEDFAVLLDKEKISGSPVEDFITQWKLPRYFVLADGDNELLVDTQQPLSVDTFIRTIKGREYIILKEFLLPAPDAVKDEKGGPYNNQLVAVLMNREPVYQSISATATTNMVKRDFLPGSEWLYYKIYCGAKMSDEILAEHLAPLVSELEQRSLIDKWFFIRYADPDFHLRIRFHIPGVDQVGLVMQLFLQQMEIVQQQGLAWKINADTYQRELERYGDELVLLAEDLFYEDSKMKLAFLSNTEGDDRETQRWLWGMRAADELLNAAGYHTAEKFECMELFRNAFAAEFKADKQLFRQINQQYSNNRKMIQQVMESPVLDQNPMKVLVSIFDEYQDEVKYIITQIKEKAEKKNNKNFFKNLLGSYLHMSLNRLFVAEPRLHEMIVYDFLCSFYRGEIKRKN